MSSAAPQAPQGVSAAEARLALAETALAEAKARRDESDGPSAPGLENAYNVAHSEHQSCLAVYRRLAAQSSSSGDSCPGVGEGSRG